MANELGSQSVAESTNASNFDQSHSLTLQSLEFQTNADPGHQRNSSALEAPEGFPSGQKSSKRGFWENESKVELHMTAEM